MKIKVILKGGTCIDVDLSKQTLVINSSKVSIIDSSKSSSAWTPGCIEEYVLPFSVLSELRL